MVIGLFQGYAHVFPQVRLITEAPDGEGEEHSQARVPPQDEGERVSVEGNRGAEEGFEEGKRVQSSTEIESTFVVVCRALTSFKVALASFGPRGTNLSSTDKVCRYMKTIIIDALVKIGAVGNGTEKFFVKRDPW